MRKQSKKICILEAAKTLFSEKGFDGTGMEEIAAASGVPKSLIYYHFKNKEELFGTIVEDFLEDYEQILQDSSERGISKIARYVDYLEKNKDCLRIMLSESLRNTSNNELLLHAVETLMAQKNQGLQSESPSSAKGKHMDMVAEFFTSIMPSIFLVCYEDVWCRRFGVEKETLVNDFISAYKITHGSYHECIEHESL